ncbi:hypothetical protein C0989_000370 [Termitomyces sp. Mn162]|nr:hypothetical protein C0989_000370 [Termitomyces sp. Mn162]KAH0582352.1 hypothetical protein H2248_010301 [Termitomyces sp. 'cryptogamus']
MSNTFVYRPPTTPVAYSVPQFQNTPYSHPPRSSTPFIPDPAIYPNSPYSRPSSLNPSPRNIPVPLPRSEPYAFPTARSAYEAGYNDDVWESQRGRFPSWGGYNQATWGNAPPPFSAPLYNAGSAASVTAGVSSYPYRRHSFSSAYRPSFESLQIHPLVNAEVPVPNFLFDLSLPQFEPLLYYSGGRTDHVSLEHLTQPVTNPPITQMRIISDTLPQEWEIELNLPHESYEFHVRQGYDPPPITVLDVLQELHRQMQLAISHNDWAKLSRADTESVRRAFTRRCRAAPGGQDGYQAERANGVKRVDYLWENTRLVGLLKVGREDGCETFKFVTDKSP